MKKIIVSIFLFLPVISYLALYRTELLSIRGVSDLLSGELVVLVIFLLLALLANYSIHKNSQLYDHLAMHNTQLSQASGESQLAKDMWKEYEQKKESSKNQLNIPSFIEAYMAEYRFKDKRAVTGVMRLIQTFASLAILIGVLGTFVGLVLSLSGIDPNQIDQSIIAILAGVHTAFYTSIAGIVYSILINLHTKYKNTEQLLLQIMLKVENHIHQKDRITADYLVVEAIDRVKNAVDSMKDSFVQVSRFSKEFQIATENLQGFNKSFKENTADISAMFGDMKTVTGVFNERSTQIHDDFGKLFTYFDSQQQIVLNVQRAFEESSHEIRKSVDIQNISMEKFTQSNQVLMEQHEKLLNSTDMKIQEAFGSLNHFFKEISGNFAKLIEQNAEQIGSNSLLTDMVYQQIKDEQDQLLKTLAEALSQKKDFEKLLVKILEGNEGAEKNLEDLNILIKEMNGIFLSLPSNNETFQSIAATLEDLKIAIMVLAEKQPDKEVQLSK